MKQEKTQLMYCIQCEVVESPSNKPFPECPKCGRAGMKVNTATSGDILAKLENNIHYLRRRLKEWRFAFWSMYFVAMGFFAAWVLK
jgi:hypothetical protein